MTLHLFGICDLLSRMTTLQVVRDEPTTLAALVAKRVRVFLAEYGIKQVSLANALGVSTGTMSKWISGKQVMNLDDIERVSDALGVAPAVFLGGDTPTPPPNGGDALPKHDGNQPTSIRLAA